MLVIGDREPWVDSERVIWKTTLNLYQTGSPVGQIIEIPAAAALVRVGPDFARDPSGEVDALWYLCQANTPKVRRLVRNFMTGESLPSGWLYLGTCAHDNGSIVVHYALDFC